MAENVVHIVNAFTANGQYGNPAGVVLDADELTEVQMLDIARQVNLSETAFVSDSTAADKRVRFFTTTNEVDLCGHATIATWSLLKSLGAVTSGHYSQETLAGVLQIGIQDDIVFMEQAPATFYETIPAAEIAPLLGIKESDCNTALQPQIVSTGLKDLMIPVANKQILTDLRPDFEAIAAFSRQHDMYSFHVFALTADANSIAAARNFDPAHDIQEECATGTSNGGMLCYLKRYNALPGQDMYRVEQGEAMGQLSYIYGKFAGDTVWIGGNAAVMGDRPVSI